MPRYIDADKIPYRFYAGDELMALKDVIDQMPTVSPDEVRGVGEWEQKEIFGVEETTIEQMQSACCSVCGKYHTTPYSYYFSKYNYCPSCGARLGNGGTDDS